MKQTNCKNCGAPITGGRCEYCGTEYIEPLNISVAQVADWELAIHATFPADPLLRRAFSFRVKCSNCGAKFILHRSLSDEQLLEGYMIKEFLRHSIKELNKEICPNCRSIMAGVRLDFPEETFRQFPELMRFLYCPEDYVLLEHFEQIRNRAFADKTERKVFINEKV